jgi:hypothetical protein
MVRKSFICPIDNTGTTLFSLVSISPGETIMMRHITDCLPPYLLRQKRKFDRTRLPHPENYYAREFPEIKQIKLKSEWFNVRCCFHQDVHPSLGIHLVSGGFHCFACGVKGGDVLAFHRLRYRLRFLEAVNQLGAWYE